MSDCEQPRMMASTLAANLSRMLPASGREREQKNRLFASRRRYDCKRLQLGSADGDTLPNGKVSLLTETLPVGPDGIHTIPVSCFSCSHDPG